MTYYGRTVDEERLRHLGSHDGSTSFAELRRYFQREHLDAIPLRATPEALKQLRGVAVLQLEIPRAGNANTDIGERTGHFVVAIGDGDGAVRVVDSTLPRHLQDKMSLESALWSWTGNVLVMRAPPGGIGWLGGAFLGFCGGAAGIVSGGFLARRRIDPLARGASADRDR